MLELAVARALYDRYPDFSEGRLAKIRSHVVSRASCAVVAGERFAPNGEHRSQVEILRDLRTALSRHDV